MQNRLGIAAFLALSTAAFGAQDLVDSVAVPTEGLAAKAVCGPTTPPGASVCRAALEVLGRNDGDASVAEFLFAVVEEGSEGEPLERGVCSFSSSENGLETGCFASVFTNFQTETRTTLCALLEPIPVEATGPTVIAEVRLQVLCDGSQD